MDNLKFLKNPSFLYLLISVGLLLFIYRNWYTAQYIIGGDWPFLYEEYLDRLPIFPSAWSEVHFNGLGGKIISYSLDSYLYFTNVIRNVISIPWNITYKFFWFASVLALMSLSAFLFSKIFFKSSITAFAIALLIFSTNTYILMVLGGGQMGVGLAYAFAPSVVALFAQQLGASRNPKSLLLFSIAGSVLLALDIRIFSVTFISVFIYLVGYLLFIPNNSLNKSIRLVGMNVLLPIIIIFFHNFFWIFPNILNPYNPLRALGEAYTSVESLKFFSFAQLSNSISLLHPNWPDNIFGKVAFQRPEFLLIPALGLLALFFIRKGYKRNILTFFFIGLLGIFLSKGANEPFGEIYIFLYEKVPGFQMFRDSTKFYLLTIISFAFLFSHLFTQISQIKTLSKYKKSIISILPFLFILFWLFTIREAFSNLGGTFSNRSVPGEYLVLKDMLANDNEFYRTLWLPKQSRFTYTDFVHPSVEYGALIESSDMENMVSALKKESIQSHLQDLSIRYIVIPHDSEGEIFLTDREYDESKRIKLERAVDALGLRKQKIGRITLYELPNYNGLFSMNGKNLSYSRVSGVKYVVEKKENQGVIIFSQNYHENWEAEINGRTITSTPSENMLNSFSVPSGASKVTIEFTEQRNYNVAWIVSLISILLTCIVLVFKKSWIKRN